MSVVERASFFSILLLSLVLISCTSEESQSVTEQDAVVEDISEAPAAVEQAVVEENIAAEDEGAEEAVEMADQDSVLEPDPTPIEAAAEADPRVVADQGGLPEGLGKDEFERICSDCHAVATAIATRRSQNEWGVVIQEMRGMGADASNIEAGLILAYLSQNFGT